MSESPKANGQWTGTYDGSNSGTIIVNVDERGPDYVGEAFLVSQNPSEPPLVAFFTIANKESKFHFRTGSIQWFDPSAFNGFGGFVSKEAIASRSSKDTVFSEYAEADGTFDHDKLTLTWETDTGTKGKCVLPRTAAGKPSELETKQLSWPEYREYVSTLTPRRNLFRGQNGPFRLRTSFHRSGRAHLHLFLGEDIPMLHKHLSARTKHLFNLQIPDENGAFFNLVQHHGYPTPLLDWTYSPYVAVFFAYRRISNQEAFKAGKDAKVRILVFDQQRWRTDWNQLPVLIRPGPHVSIGEFLSVENERMIPQQAASTITNVDDMESYIKSKESHEKKYLWAIDLSVGDRKRVLGELSYMGITDGSMFPGLDGACAELKERNFEI
jgi:hypothetical protein